jgi:hypothetical protein
MDVGSGIQTENLVQTIERVLHSDILGQTSGISIRSSARVSLKGTTYRLLSLTYFGCSTGLRTRMALGSWSGYYAEPSDRDGFYLQKTRETVHLVFLDRDDRLHRYVEMAITIGLRMPPAGCPNPPPALLSGKCGPPSEET